MAMHATAWLSVFSVPRGGAADMHESGVLYAVQHWQIAHHIRSQESTLVLGDALTSTVTHDLITCRRDCGSAVLSANGSRAGHVSSVGDTQRDAGEPVTSFPELASCFQYFFLFRHALQGISGMYISEIEPATGSFTFSQA